MARERRHRMTAPRRVLSEELDKSRLHPTADDLYRILKRRLPEVSLGTVYRNLEFLVGKGSVRVLAFGDGPRRYDGDLRVHHHVRCISCGRVADVGGDVHFQVADLDVPESFTVVGYDVALLGICRRCVGRRLGRVKLMAVKSFNGIPNADRKTGG